MTCVAAYVDKKRKTMWMAADTLCSDGHIGYDRKEPKIFESEDFLIGFSGNPRFYQIIKYSNGFPKPYGDLHRFMCSEFVAHVASTLNETSYIKKKEDTLKIPGYSSMVVLVGGRSFTLYSDFQIEENTYPYVSIGSGSEVAMGSLWTSNKSGLLAKNPKSGLTDSVKAASAFVMSVGGRTQVKSKKY